MPLKKWLLISCLFLHSFCGYGQEVWTAGPMIHIYWGNCKPRVSYAAEVAYWNLNDFNHSVDFGLEFGRQKILLYSELQTGIGVAGISCGPVLQFTTNGSGTHLGLQGSFWANYFLGLDFRKRWINKTSLNALGLYVKVPFKTTGMDNNSSSSGGYDWDD